MYALGMEICHPNSLFMIMSTPLCESATERERFASFALVSTRGANDRLQMHIFCDEHQNKTLENSPTLGFAFELKTQFQQQPQEVN